MNKKTLNYLTKKDLIEIITSDSMWERKAFFKVTKLVHDKVNAIIDEQEKCIHTTEGMIRYWELEKEYQKWSDIQANLGKGNKYE